MDMNLSLLERMARSADFTLRDVEAVSVAFAVCGDVMKSGQYADSFRTRYGEYFEEALRNTLHAEGIETA